MRRKKTIDRRLRFCYNGIIDERPVSKLSATPSEIKVAPAETNKSF
jgi:hypothetical protein